METLHDRYFNLWLEQTAIAIRNRDLSNMDCDNLLDEIEDMGASQKRALDSYLQRLIEQILKLHYWYVDRNKKGSLREVINFRNRINRILKKNPSLKNYIAQEYEDIWQDAIAVMGVEFEIPETSFVSLEKIMQNDYFG